MKKLSWLKYPLFLASVILLISSCKSKQLLLQQGTTERALKEQIKKIDAAQPKFRTANVSRMSATFDVSGRRFSTQANCKIKTDSVIHISIQPFLGFEMFKIEIDKDSIFAFDKVNKKLYAVGFDYFKTKIGIKASFRDIQNVLSNRYNFSDTEKLNSENWKQQASENNLSILEHTNGDLIEKYFINNLDRIEKVRIKSQKTAYNAEIVYGAFLITDTILFPQEINIVAGTEKRQLKAGFKISKLSFDVPVTFNNIDRSKYTRADLSQLMNK